MSPERTACRRGCKAGRSSDAPEKPPSSKLSRIAPALMGLALDVGLRGLALGVEGVEVLLKTVLGRDPRVDRAAQRLRGWAGHERSPGFWPRRPKKRGPFQRVPVMARATCDRLLKVVPFQA